MVMLLLKRSGGGAASDRDVIFLAESGERSRPHTGVGINFMVAQHFDEIDAEYSRSPKAAASRWKTAAPPAPALGNAAEKVPHARVFEAPSPMWNLRPRLCPC